MFLSDFKIRLKISVSLVSLLFVSVFSLNLFLTQTALADDSSSPGVAVEIGAQLNAAAKTSNLGTKDPRETVTRIINYALGLLGMIFVAYIVYSGFLWMTAGGDEKKIEDAQRHIRNGIIGLVIVLAAYSIMLLVTTYLIRATANQYFQQPYGTSPY